ncbi:hypothetical protein EK21DRAFT_88266 [Setomelanomma holmii]|uniref:Uncharacterized protein n=1 Tax=Setomelanomma holmii TaxID=210430 RepID=A0A9P4LND6_9PLEO|nr:hypothetical protein EK21DRAFT_88266 [Setomelanomma holmii]
MTDGEFVIWAQGKAGWFEIRPAPHYQSIYTDMIQAVQLLYFVTDIYSGPRKRGGGPSPQLIFQEVSSADEEKKNKWEYRVKANVPQYAEDERFPCNDPAVAADIFDKHHIFLIMCFLIRAQGISWSNTPVYQYFRRQFPKDFDTCKARTEGRYNQKLPERPMKPTISSPAAPTPVTAPKTKQGRGKTSIQKSDVAPKKDNNWWQTAALFEFMQKAVNQRVLRAGRNQITLERVAQLIVKRYEIDELETAQNVLLVHAQNLRYMMDHPRRKSIRFYAQEPIYRELAGHSLPAAEQRRAEGVELRPRKDHGTLREEEIESSDTSDEDEDKLTTPVRRPPGRRRRGRLSVLRPRSSKFSGKSKGIKKRAGKGKAPPVPNSDSSDNNGAAEADENATDSEDEMGMDTPTQALSPGREKRKLDETDTDEAEDQTRRKRAASASITPESPPTTAESENSDEDLTAPDGTNPPLPLRYRPINPASRPHSSHTNTKPVIAPILVSTPLPTYEPNGPRDSWICSFDGCTQRIYGCSKELGRQLITEHLEDHAKGREKVVGILWREQDKLHLPVSNLIKRIREMSEATTPFFPLGVGEKVQPRPIERHA